MEKSLAVAKAMSIMYKEMYHRDIDELKMHKLMYFAQRESFIRDNHSLLSEDFSGWKYGPVLLSVREEFSKPNPFSSVEASVSDETLDLISDVLQRYGDISSWRLSVLSHEELSWKISRNGLGPTDNGHKPLMPEAIKLDAIRESISRDKALR